MKGKMRGDIEIVAEIRKLDYGLDKPDQYGMDASQISQLAYYRGLPGANKPESVGAGKLIQLETGANAAMYPLEYVLDFLKLASKSGASHIILATGKNKPLWACAVVSVEDALGDGTRTLEYALAPRIEGDAIGQEPKGVMLKPAAPANFRVAADADFKDTPKIGEEVAAQPETAPKIETVPDVKEAAAEDIENCWKCGGTLEPYHGALYCANPACDCSHIRDEESKPDASDIEGDAQAQAIVEKMKAPMIIINGEKRVLEAPKPPQDDTGSLKMG